MFGPFENVQRMVGKMSVPELVALAKNPSGGDPNVQFAAVSEIEKRKNMKASPQGPQGPQPTVMEKMAMEAMTPPQQAPTPGDPIRAGVMAMMAQQQQGGGGPPQAMAGGGQVRGSAGTMLNNMGGIMDVLAPYYDTSAMTPEEARALVSEFYGPADYLDQAGEFKREERDASLDRNRDLWMALAQAGFGMASTGDIGQGALMGMEQARGALDRYGTARDRTRDRRDRNRNARGMRDDRLAGSGLEALLNDRNRAESSQERLLSSASGIASAGAQIDSANQRDRSQLQEIADALYAENEGEVVWEQYDAPGAMNNIGMRQRPYSRQDAMRDALQMVGGRGGAGRGADDLNERLRSATFLADPANMGSPEQQEMARQVLDDILRGELGNSNTTTRGGPSARGNSAPSEAGFNRNNVRGLEEYQQSRGPRVIGEREGQRVYSPY